MCRNAFYKILFFVVFIHVGACSKTEDAHLPSVFDVEAASENANRLFDEVFDTLIARYPENQTYLGVKEGNDRWNDISDAYAQETQAVIKRQLEKLNALDPQTLDDQAQLSLRLYKQSLQNRIDDFQWRFHGYPINQMFGVHTAIPSLLINSHQVSDQKDIEAYLSRIRLVSQKIDQVITNLEIKKEKGVYLPAFVFPYAIGSSENIISGRPFEKNAEEENAIWADFKKELEKIELTDDELKAQLLADAEQALVNDFAPAYQKLIQYLKNRAGESEKSDGVWALPNGDEYYKVRLARNTTTSMSADEVHQLGLKNVERIHNEMREIKQKVGFEGDLSAFFTFMREDPQFYFEDSQEGRDQYLAENQAFIDKMDARLDEIFLTRPKARLEVKPVEAFREKTAGMAFYQGPSIDGGRPGIYYINLYDMSSVSKFQMEALAYHEAIPGHHMQISISKELQGLPKFRKYTWDYTAYVEGWGLYSEKLPKEFGFYEDPYSDFGRLSMELWRAARLVVDTGLHAKQWSREKAIEYLKVNTPSSEQNCVKAIERYMVMPGQATSYYIGMQKILDLRVWAKEQLKADFDIRAFHDVLLKNGSLPLDELQLQVETWVESVRI